MPLDRILPILTSHQQLLLASCCYCCSASLSSTIWIQEYKKIMSTCI
jgi:hypothetical protein